MNKNNKGTVKFAIAALAITLAGCGGGSGSGGDSSGVDDTGKQTPQPGQALLGPVVGATVTIRDIEDLDTVACTTTTSDNDDLANAGRISFNQPCIVGDHLYLVSVVGGNDIDYNDDGVRDASPTVNNGEFRALLSAEQLLQSNWKTTALTEVTYQAVQYALQLGETDLAAIVDDIAQQLLIQDVTADGVIDRFDIAQWHPITHAAAVINVDKLQFSTQLIHQNLNRTLAEIPDAETLAGRIDTLAPARQVLAYNDLLLVTTDIALLIYRVDGNSSTLVSSLALGWIYDMTLAQDALYIALGGSGIARIDLSDPARPAVSERWPYHAQWLASVGNRIVFTTTTHALRQSLMTIDESGALQVVLEDEQAANFLPPSRADQPPALKSINGIVYWAPFSDVNRLILQQDSWQEIPALDFVDAVAASRNVYDVDVVGNKVHVVAETEYLTAPPRAGGQYRKAVMVHSYDVSDRDNPLLNFDTNASDFTAMHSVNGELIAIDGHAISLLTADLERAASLQMPAGFSGFDPETSVTGIGGLVAVAANENGVLLLSMDKMPINRYQGQALLRGPVVGAHVRVINLETNTTACETTTTDDGSIAIPVTCVAAKTYHDVEVSGGRHVYNGEEIAFQGRLHTVMDELNFQQPGWIVSYISTLAFDILQPASIQTPLYNNISYGLYDISEWLLNVRYATYDTLLHTDPFSQPLFHPAEPARVENAISQLQNGSWDGTTVMQSLTGASNFLRRYAPSASSAVANAENLFVAHENGIDIYSSAAQPQHLGRIGDDSWHLAVDTSTLAVFEALSTTITLYDITNASSAVVRHTYARPTIYGDWNALTSCITTTHLFVLVDDRVLRSYRFTDNGLLEIPDASGHVLAAAKMQGCAENQVQVLDSTRLDIATVTNAGVTWQSLSNGSPISASTQSGDTVAIVLGDGTLQRFTRQANGSFQRTAQSAPAEIANADCVTPDYLTIRIAGDRLFADGCKYEMQIIDLQTLQTERHVSMPRVERYAANEDFAWPVGRFGLVTIPLQ